MHGLRALQTRKVHSYTSYLNPRTSPSSVWSPRDEQEHLVSCHNQKLRQCPGLLFPPSPCLPPQLPEKYWFHILSILCFASQVTNWQEWNTHSGTHTHIWYEFLIYLANKRKRAMYCGHTGQQMKHNPFPIFSLPWIHKRYSVAGTTLCIGRLIRARKTSKFL